MQWTNQEFMLYFSENPTCGWDPSVWALAAPCPPHHHQPLLVFIGKPWRFHGWQCQTSPGAERAVRIWGIDWEGQCGPLPAQQLSHLPDQKILEFSAWCVKWLTWRQCYDCQLSSYGRKHFLKLWFISLVPSPLIMGTNLLRAGTYFPLPRVSFSWEQHEPSNPLNCNYVSYCLSYSILWFSFKISLFSVCTSNKRRNCNWVDLTVHVVLKKNSL